MAGRYGDDASSIVISIEQFSKRYFKEGADIAALEERLFASVRAITEKGTYSDSFVGGYRNIFQTLQLHTKLPAPHTPLDETFIVTLNHLYEFILKPWKQRFFETLDLHVQLDNLEQEFMRMLDQGRTVESWIRDYRVMFSAAVTQEGVNPFQVDPRTQETVTQNITALSLRLQQLPVQAYQENAKRRVLSTLQSICADLRQNMEILQEKNMAIADPIVFHMHQKWWELPP